MVQFLQSEITSYSLCISSICVTFALTFQYRASSHNLYARHNTSHPDPEDLEDLLFSLFFTGPPGKRGRMGRRGEPGKWRPPPASFVYFSFLSFPGRLSLIRSHTHSLFFLGDSRSSRAGKHSDTWACLVDDGPQLALSPLSLQTQC